MAQAQNVVGAGFSHAAAGPLSGFMGLKLTDGPRPDLKGFPRPKMLLELALAMLRLAPWLVLLGFKTDVRLAPSLVLWISKLTDGPRSRSQRLPQAQNVVGASFSDAAAGPLSGFTGLKN